MGAVVTEYNLNDNTVSGLRLKDRPVFSVPSTPTSPGPNDANHLFEAFHKLVAESKKLGFNRKLSLWPAVFITIRS